MLTEAQTNSASIFEQRTFLSEAQNQLEAFQNGGRFVLQPWMVENRIEIPGITTRKPDVVIMSYVTVTPGRGPGAQAQRLYDGLRSTFEENNIPVCTVEPFTQQNGYHANLPDIRGKVDMTMDPEQSSTEQIASAHQRTEAVYYDVFTGLATEWLAANDGNTRPLNISIVDVGYDGMSEFSVKGAVERIKNEMGIDVYVTIVTVDSSFDSGNPPSTDLIHGYPVDVSNPTSFDSNDQVTCVRLAVNSSAPNVDTYIDSPSATSHSIFAAAGHPIPTEVVQELYGLRAQRKTEAKHTLAEIYQKKGVDQRIIDLLETSDVINVEMNNQYLDNKNHLGRKVQSDEQHQDVELSSTNLILAFKTIAEENYKTASDDVRSVLTQLLPNATGDAQERIQKSLASYERMPQQKKDTNSRPITVLVPKRYLDMARELGGNDIGEQIVAFGGDSRPVYFVERQGVNPSEMGTLFAASELVISRSSQMNADAEAKIAGVPVLDIDMPGHNFMWSTSAGKWYAEQGGLSYNNRQKVRTHTAEQILQEIETGSGTAETDVEEIWENRASTGDYAMAILNMLDEPTMRDGVIQNQDTISLTPYNESSGKNVYTVIKYLFNLL